MIYYDNTRKRNKKSGQINFDFLFAITTKFVDCKSAAAVDIYALFQSKTKLVTDSGFTVALTLSLEITSSQSLLF
jgi:hypothetical protein